MKPQLPTQSSAFLSDLYRDLRDRRLIVPALAVLAAIAAVPFVLASPDSPEPPAPPLVTDPDAQAVRPAVLAEGEVGVRDFRERLDVGKRKDPFSDKFSSQPGADESPAPDDVPVDQNASRSAGAASGGGSGPAGASAGAAPPAPSPAPAASTAPAVSPDPEPAIFAPRIDARVGEVGEREKVESVKPGRLLPDRRKAPVLMFLGASPSLERADFLVSKDVRFADGDGSCRPRRHDCEFLRLRDGETHYLLFGPDATRYSIKVTDIFDKAVSGD